MNLDALRDMLVEEEGIKLRVYEDSLGVPTIGVGRNLRGKGISRDEAMLLLENDIKDAVEAVRFLPGWDALSEVRQRVLVDMTFNLGIGGLMGFKGMLAAVAVGNFDDAADHMLGSLWARQVGRRATRLAAMMRTGEDPPL